MTKEELAAKLSGCQYTHEIDESTMRMADKDGLVVVFGASDDLIEFRGAIYDGLTVYDGGTAFLTKEGLLINECRDSKCPYFEREKDKARRIMATWGDNPAWTYQTDIPHATFDVMEDGEVYCRGIVFDIKDL